MYVTKPIRYLSVSAITSLQKSPCSRMSVLGVTTSLSKGACFNAHFLRIWTNWLYTSWMFAGPIIVGEERTRVLSRYGPQSQEGCRWSVIGTDVGGGCC